jgi:multicomponent Na+:H+ antiporter subunit A
VSGRHPRIAVFAGAAVALAAVAFALCVWAWSSRAGGVDLAWAPTLGLRAHFEMDGLGALYSLLATGIGVVVFAYAAAYLPRHLAHQNRPDNDAPRFFAWLVVFMGAMVGLATAQDLILLFVFWDLTAVASYFLIGYDRHERASREAALMALLVTGISAVALLIAALVLRDVYGTFSLPELAAAVQPGAATTTAALLIAVAGLAKSAQLPFQFWLPRAMAAPTPVSAYLHSAAMVAAGVFLLSRLYPVLQQSSLVLDLLLAFGLGSIAVGGLLALHADAFKRLLAYSTVSQYGYVVFMLGLGGAHGAAGACFYVLAHGIAKSALFMTAGAVTEATGGRTRLSEVGGLARPLPVLAAGSLAAAAGIAALPLTAGFFKDELLFTAALERGHAFAGAAALAAALTFAYMARFWAGVFLGRRAGDASPLPAGLQGPVLVLGAITVLGGVFVTPLRRLAEAAGAATLGRPTAAEVAYHLDLRAENVLALAAYGGGILILLGVRRRPAVVAAIARAGEALGPERWYRSSLVTLNRVSDAMHDLEVRDLRTRVAAVLVPGGILVAAGVVATPTERAYVVGTIGDSDVVPALVLVATVIAGVAVTRPRDHLLLVLALSGVGFCLAAVYALLGGPDVALVAVGVETLLALFFLAVLALLPRATLRREAAMRSSRQRRRRDAIIAVVAGVSVFVVVWGALSRPSVSESVAAEHLRRTESAHAKDTVTAILADFRGLDTLVEVTVVTVALVAILGLLRARRPA